MIKDFLKEYGKLIADKPEKIDVELVKLSASDDIFEIIIKADKVDTGKFIGKDGRMISAIKSVISCDKSKKCQYKKVTVKPCEE